MHNAYLIFWNVYVENLNNNWHCTRRKIGKPSMKLPVGGTFSQKDKEWLLIILICNTSDPQMSDHISHSECTYPFLYDNLSPGDVRQPQHQHQLLPLHRRGRGHGLAAAPPPPGPPGDLALRHGELSLVEGWSRDLVTSSDWSRWAATSTTCSTAGWTVSSGSRPSINKIEIIIVVDE